MAGVFASTTVLLAIVLVAGWMHVRSLMLVPVELPEQAAVRTQVVPVSPLMVQYHLDMPGRGEIFPALTAESSPDYWPVALLRVSNNADSAVVQTVTAEVPGWSRKLEQTIIIGPRSSETLRLNPPLLGRAFRNEEIRRATVEVRASFPGGVTAFSQTRPVYLHGGSDLYWGKRFANAQYVARWVTPHDESVMKLVSAARRHAPRGRMAGYISSQPGALDQQVRTQARAVYTAMRRSGISYVSSIFTFGAFTDKAQRIRLPRETLSLSTANCMDVSVAFASAMENLGMHPVLVIVPGHAFTGVRLSPNSSEVLYLDLTVLPNGTFEQAAARAQTWFRKFPAQQIITVDVSSARAMGIFPMPAPDVQVAD